ncbi:protein ASPARTIC PROTEASE IN GUARD CELL 1 [Cucumis melo var. makuwa]|uniref:Protein ASPARTIC PROTEASE IN GUARD CELL 1 n=1 Tax=Cucumis melo var. makuwa TaxID=1194695 RepID=A0A5D3DY88_CUCMM|nr:protein ASPARTIC PROTEASE IN GUARD CELL 1 [Cucumis melo var. makuwa]
MMNTSLSYALLFLTIFTFLQFPSILSRKLTAQSPYSTTTFDVSASINQALNALSIKPKPFQTHSYHSNSPLSLSLHPRLTVHNPSYKDYGTLVRARLARHATRVQSLNRKLELSLNGAKQFGKRINGSASTNSLTAPVTSGASHGDGEYFARIGVGQPVQSFFLVPDTGSDVTWLQCKPCANENACFKQLDPIFDPKLSSSYSSLSCDSEQCQLLDEAGCSSNSCIYEVEYGDGSFTIGELATETLSFGNSNSIPNLPIGCGHDNEGLFDAAAGLIGLGGGAISLSSQLQASSFSYCLVDLDSDSSSTLDFNADQPSDSLTSPLVKNNRFPSFRYVKVIGMSVGGKRLPISSSRFEIDESGSGGIIVDSGTTITQLPSDVYDVLRDAFVGLTTNLPTAPGVSPFDTCYDLSSQSSVEVPIIAFILPGGKSLKLPAKNCLIQVDSAGTFCLAFLPGTFPLSIIGNVQQQGIRVSYDLDNSIVGFATNKC